MYHCTVSPYRRNCMQENAKVEHWHAHCKLRAVQVPTSATRKDALGKAPHRAFAYAQFCNGKAYKECWTSEKVTFSFSLMVEGLSLTLNCKSLRHFVNFDLPYWPYFFALAGVQKSNGREGWEHYCLPEQIWTFFMRSNNNNHLWYPFIIFYPFPCTLESFCIQYFPISVFCRILLLWVQLHTNLKPGPIKDWGLCKGSLLDRCWQHFGAAAFKFLECQRWNLKITVLYCDCNNGNTVCLRLHMYS